MQYEELQAIWETQTQRPVFALNEFGLHMELNRTRARARRRHFWVDIFPLFVIAPVFFILLAVPALRFFLQGPPEQFAPGDLPMTVWDVLVCLAGIALFVYALWSMEANRRRSEKQQKVFASVPAAGDRARHRSHGLRYVPRHERPRMAGGHRLHRRSADPGVGIRAPERQSSALEDFVDGGPLAVHFVLDAQVLEAASRGADFETQAGAGSAAREARRESCGKMMERVMGIEPTLVAWEATVLPLNYTRARPEDESARE